MRFVLFYVTMSYALSLQDYIRAYHHPAHVPVTSHTSYTNQFIKSADDYEADVRNVLARLHDERHRNTFHHSLVDKMDTALEEETAFLIEKTNQQSFVTLIAGVILTGLIYTALLIFKPTTSCSKELRIEKDISQLKSLLPATEDINEIVRTVDEKSVTTNGLLCSAASQPLITSLAVVWIPIIIFTIITGYMVRNVTVGERIMDMDIIDQNDTGGDTIVVNMDAEVLQRLIQQKMGMTKRQNDFLSDYDVVGLGY